MPGRLVLLEQGVVLRVDKGVVLGAPVRRADHVAQRHVLEA